METTIIGFIGIIGYIVGLYIGVDPALIKTAKDGISRRPKTSEHTPLIQNPPPPPTERLAQGPSTPDRFQ